MILEVSKIYYVERHRGSAASDAAAMCNAKKLVKSGSVGHLATFALNG